MLHFQVRYPDTARVVDMAHLRRQHEPLEVAGTLRPLGDPPPGVDVTLSIREGRLSITGERVGELGTWDVADVAVSQSEEGSVLSVDGEHLAVTYASQAQEEVLIESLAPRGWWWMILPAVGGLLLALAIWILAV